MSIEPINLGGLVQVLTLAFGIENSELGTPAQTPQVVFGTALRHSFQQCVTGLGENEGEPYCSPNSSLYQCSLLVV